MQFLLEILIREVKVDSYYKLILELLLIKTDVYKLTVKKMIVKIFVLKTLDKK